jgi:hypothetical protein
MWPQEKTLIAVSKCDPPLSRAGLLKSCRFPLQVEKEELCHTILTERDCNVPLFTKVFRDAFPTVEQMMGPLGLNTLRLWLDSKLMNTKRSELGHAQERRAVSAATGPGASFIKHTRRYVLQRAKEIHVSRGGLDPCRGPRFRKAITTTARDEPDPFAKFVPIGALQAIDKKCLDPHEHKQALVDKTKEIMEQAPMSALEHERGPLVIAAQESILAHGVLVERNAKSGSGGNPYYTFLNFRRMSAKQASTTGTLTLEELRTVNSQTREAWSAMTVHEKEPFKNRFTASVRRRQLGLPVECDAPPSDQPSYSANFGIGCHMHVMTPKVFEEAAIPMDVVDLYCTEPYVFSPA